MYIYFLYIFTGWCIAVSESDFMSSWTDSTGHFHEKFYFHDKQRPTVLKKVLDIIFLLCVCGFCSYSSCLVTLKLQVWGTNRNSEMPTLTLWTQSSKHPYDFILKSLIFYSLWYMTCMSVNFFAPLHWFSLLFSA